MQVYFKSVSSRGAAININIAHAIAKALIQRYPDIVAILIFDASSLTKSSFKGMGFVRL